MSIISSAKSYVQSNPGMFIAKSIVVILLLVVLVSWLKPSQDGGQGEPICKALGNDPWDNTTKLVNLKSPDFRALARFSAVLLINDTANSLSYLPMTANSIEYATTTQNKWSTLTIESDCAQLTLHIDGDDPPNFRLSQIVANFDLGSGSRDVCTAKVKDVSFNQSNHYACDKLRSYSCSTIIESKVEYTLLIHGLEFEINGKTDMIKQGKYSTPSKVC